MLLIGRFAVLHRPHCLTSLCELQKESLVRVKDQLVTLDKVVDADAKVCFRQLHWVSRPGRSGGRGELCCRMIDEDLAIEWARRWCTVGS